MMIPDWYFGKIPEYMRGGVMRYVQSGIEPGGFTRAVLENNFFLAARRADQTNIRQFYDWGECLLLLPPECWGSVEKVEKWIAHNGLEGLEKDNE